MGWVISVDGKTMITILTVHFVVCCLEFVATNTSNEM